MFFGKKSTTTSGTGRTMRLSDSVSTSLPPPSSAPRPTPRLRATPRVRTIAIPVVRTSQPTDRRPTRRRVPAVPKPVTLERIETMMSGPTRAMSPLT